MGTLVRGKDIKLNNKIIGLLSFVIPFSIIMFYFALNGIFPFGDNCIIISDCAQQYYPFFVEFQNKLQNGESLAYSWNLGLGADFYAVFVYYLSSPLNFLIYFVGENDVVEFVMTLIVVKICLSGTTFWFYLKEHFGNKKLIHALVFSTAFALGGFNTTYFFNIMWLDVIVLTPIVLLGLEKLVREQKPALYFISLSFCIISNYYLSIILCIFLVLYFLVLIIQENVVKKEAFIQFGIFSALSGGVSAFLIIPEAIALSGSTSSGVEFPEKIELYFSVVAAFTRGNAAASNYYELQHWPSIYAGAFSFFLLFLYIFNSKINRKVKLCNLSLTGFILISFCVNYLDFFWHGLHFPNAFPARQSFLYIFLLLVMGYNVVLESDSIKKWHILCSVVICLIILPIGYLGSDHFVSVDASFYVTGVFIIIYALLAFVLSFDKIKKYSFVKMILFLLALLELTFSFYNDGYSYLVKSEYENYQKIFKDTNNIAINDQADDDTANRDYRIDVNEMNMLNGSLLGGFSSTSSFTSLINNDICSLFAGMGMYGGNRVYSISGGIPYIYDILSVKYILSKEDKQNDKYWEMVDKVGSNYVYKNNDVLPLCFSLKSKSTDVSFDMDKDAIHNLDLFGNALGAMEDTLIPVNGAVETGYMNATIKIDRDGYYFYVPNESYNTTIRVDYPDGYTKEESKMLKDSLFDLGYCKKGEKICISYSALDSVEFDVFTLNEKAVEEVRNNLNDSLFTLQEKNENGLSGKVICDKPETLIFSVQMDKGWELFVDGKKTDIEKYMNCFISAYIDKGEHTIELVYHIPGLKIGVGISVLSLVLAVCLLRFSGIKIDSKNKKRIL